jgi:hypothetical protein
MEGIHNGEKQDNEDVSISYSNDMFATFALNSTSLFLTLRKELVKEFKAAEKAVLPFHVSPFNEAKEFESIHLRHQSNLIELFFDLFLAADLATFTAAHSIVDRGSLVAYVGFFLIIWSTWFQITLHDVRFAQDSIYERICKVCQFVVFVAFALIGADFSPEEGGEKEDGGGKRSHLVRSSDYLLKTTNVVIELLAPVLYATLQPGHPRCPIYHRFALTQPTRTLNTTPGAECHCVPCVWCYSGWVHWNIC